MLHSNHLAWIRHENLELKPRMYGKQNRKRKTNQGELAGYTHTFLMQYPIFCLRSLLKNWVRFVSLPYMSWVTRGSVAGFLVLLKSSPFRHRKHGKKLKTTINTWGNQQALILTLELPISHSVGKPFKNSMQFSQPRHHYQIASSGNWAMGLVRMTTQSKWVVAEKWIWCCGFRKERKGGWLRDSKECRTKAKRGEGWRATGKWTVFWGACEIWRRAGIGALKKRRGGMCGHHNEDEGSQTTWLFVREICETPPRLINRWWQCPTSQILKLRQTTYKRKGHVDKELIRPFNFLFFLH